MATQDQFCDNCGAGNPPTARFCQYCASPLPFRHITGTLPEQTQLSGRYQLETRIGQGGMGAVYKAVDARFNNRPIAIKEMSRAGLSPASIAEAEAAFEHEAQLLAELLHPNLPRIYDHFTEEERSYLVMDFIEGKTLEDYLESSGGKPLPIDQVLTWATQLCDVLSYLHNHQPPIIFRDLKPSNVMVSEASGHIYLIDFGIARVFKPGQSHDTVALGSPGFAAPEQYGKAQSTPRSDIYSLGSLLHNLLTGVDPSEQPFFFKPARQLNPLVPQILEELLQRMLEMDADKRPASAQEVMQVLRQVEQQRISGTLGQISQPIPILSTIGASMSGMTQTATVEGRDPILQDAYRSYTQRRLPEALALYDRAVKTGSTNPLAWQGRGLTLAHMSDHMEALRSFEQALRLAPDLVISLNGKGAALNILGRNREALQAFDQAILRDEKNVIAWNGKGATLSALGDPENALASIDAALLYDPDMAPAWGNKGLVLRQLRHYPEALQAFDRALALTSDNDPGAVRYWNGKGLVLYEMGKLSEALLAYQQALRIQPGYAPALCGIGDVLSAQGKLKGALDHFERALANDRRLVKAWERRGMVLADMDRLNKSLESYDEALRLDPRYAPAWNGKASVLCRVQRYEDALYAYDRALTLQPNAAHAWNGKGNAFYHLQNYQMALDAYDRALRLHPRMVTALHNKSLVLKHLGRYDEALDAAEAAVRLDAKDADNWLRKAEALKKLHRKREARDAEMQAARLRGEA
jgi:serine/threonine protein kinase/lipoprotein NlpI